MAKNMNAFLAQNVEKIKAEKFVATERIKEDGKPVEWEIGCITGAEDSALRASCTNQVQVRKHQYRDVFDANGYVVKLAARCTLYPDLNDQALQDSYGVKDAASLLSTMLTPGELNEYAAKVQAVNGFDVPLDELKDEAKN